MIEPETGPRVVLLAYARQTGQNVKRAATGAEGHVLDHYSRPATEAHLRAVGDPMLDAVPAALVGSVFCDSLEVYGADWTPGLPAEFARRRGYDLLPRLHLLDRSTGRSAARPPRRLPPHPGRAVRGELRRRLPALGRRARRAVPDPVVRGAAGHGEQLPVRGPLRGRGLGLAGCRSDPVGVVGAHLYGAPSVSAEVWTWVHSPPSAPPRWT